MGTRPPIGFLGHKGRWYEFIQDAARRLPRGAVVYDLFGGSGIVSHALIKARPDLRVFWNDFDDYMARLDHLPETEELRQRLKSHCGPRGKVPKFAKSQGHLSLTPLTDDTAAGVAELRRAHEARFGFIDPMVLRWTDELPGYMTAGVPKNRIPNKALPLAQAAAYARVLRPARVRFDVMGFKPPAGAFYVIDPPYQNTRKGGYKGQNEAPLFPVIAEAVKGGRAMVFCGIHEAEFYASMFGGPYRRHELLIRNCGFNANTRVEVCLSQWPRGAVY